MPSFLRMRPRNFKCYVGLKEVGGYEVVVNLLRIQMFFCVQSRVPLKLFCNSSFQIPLFCNNMHQLLSMIMKAINFIQKAVLLALCVHRISRKIVQKDDNYFYLFCIYIISSKMSKGIPTINAVNRLELWIDSLRNIQGAWKPESCFYTQ